MIMKPIDESLLSAFLDGELRSKQRARIESALREDGGLVVRLRRLEEARSAVGGLSRPCSPDVSGRVVARIESVGEVGRRRSARMVRPARVLAFGIGLVATAALWLTMVYLGPRRERLVEGPSFAGSPEPEEADLVGGTEIPGPPVESVAVEPLPDLPAALFGGGLSQAQPALYTAADRARSERFEAALRGRSPVIRVDLAIDGGAIGELGDLVARSARVDPDFARFELSVVGTAGVDLLGGGAVIALIADGHELENLLRRIRERFGREAVSGESAADHGLASRLTGAGPFLVASGSRAGTLLEPPAEVIARKEEADPGLPRPEVSRSAIAGVSAAARAAAARVDRQMVVLLWVPLDGVGGETR